MIRLSRKDERNIVMAYKFSEFKHSKMAIIALQDLYERIIKSKDYGIQEEIQKKR